eukprot:6182807-Pleurochrysis_carterae.AAC.1
MSNIDVSYAMTSIEADGAGAGALELLLILCHTCFGRAKSSPAQDVLQPVFFLILARHTCCTRASLAINATNQSTKRWRQTVPCVLCCSVKKSDANRIAVTPLPSTTDR